MASTTASQPPGIPLSRAGTPFPIESLLRSLPAAIYTCDAEGRVTFFNDAAAALWGRTPVLGSDLWCGSWRIYRPDGSPMPLDSCPMALALKEGRSIRGIEIVIERPDGQRRRVLPHPDPLRDASGAIVGAVNMLVDITDSRTGEEAHSLLAAIVESSDDAIVSKTLEGRITSWNTGAERIFGYKAAEVIGKSITILIPPDRLDEEPQIIERLRRGERMDHFETVRIARNGREVNVSLTVSPVRDRSGRIVGASKVARDITEQKRIQELLHASERRQQAMLEEAVRLRTEELNATHEQLRLSERMVSLGTLSAGLGHDMGNLLLPVRISLESLEGAGLPDGLKYEVASIRVAVDYLQQLSNGLRYLAIDPHRSGPVEPLDLHEWWKAVSMLLKGALPRGVVLHADLPADCWVRMSKSALTQTVFNLVQNAGDAMKARGTGNVHVSGSCADNTLITLTVTDDGPGMTPQVRDRCMQPFFTTKSRGVSTGMGLVLVAGLVREAGGSVAIATEPGKGTTFTLTLPGGHGSLRHPHHSGRQLRALVKLDDARLGSFVRTQLQTLSFNVVTTDQAANGVQLAVVDDFSNPACKADRTIIFDDLNGTPPPPNHVLVGKSPSLRAIRDALVAAANDARRTGGFE